MKNYKNPIILCDYSDPDVIRVGDTFYMTASSFNFTPGLPLLASKNLVDWKLISYAAKSVNIPGYEFPRHACGLWAPSIRFHDGFFYIFVATPDEGIFYTKTSDPYGIDDNWTPLEAVWLGKGFEDPCPLWDDDGKVYLVHGYVKSRIGFNSKLGLLELDPETLKAKSEDKIIFDGSKTQPTIEGPKFYKIGKLYYILAPAGGVTEGWQTALRSLSPFGPYEEKIVMSQGDAKINGPHQGGLVDTLAGEWWFMHFQERGIFGRIVHLQPVKWHFGWPCMGTAALDGNLPGKPFDEYKMPKVALLGNGGNLDFTENPDANWQWSANGREDFAEFLSGKKSSGKKQKYSDIKLNVLDTRENLDGEIPNLWDSANVLTQKISRENFTFSCKIDISKMGENSRTGLIFMGGSYASLALEKSGGEVKVLYLTSKDDGSDKKQSENIENKIIFDKRYSNNLLNLKICFKKTGERSGKAVFLIQTGGIFKPFKWQSPEYECGKAHWVGGRFGIYAVGKESGCVTVSDIKIY